MIPRVIRVGVLRFSFIPTARSILASSSSICVLQSSVIARTFAHAFVLRSVMTVDLENHLASLGFD